MAEGRFRDEITIYGRVREQGLTDRSSQVDAYGLVRGYLGFGPDGTQPENNRDWIWIWARPNEAFDGNAVGEPDADEYQARLFIPLPGQYDYAYRFTVDGGRSWLYCDGGEAGSSNGYRVEDAGQLTAIPHLSPVSLTRAPVHLGALVMGPLPSNSVCRGCVALARMVWRSAHILRNALIAARMHRFVSTGLAMTSHRKHPVEGSLSSVRSCTIQMILNTLQSSIVPS